MKLFGFIAGSPLDDADATVQEGYKLDAAKDMVKPAAHPGMAPAHKGVGHVMEHGGHATGHQQKLQQVQQQADATEAKLNPAPKPPLAAIFAAAHAIDEVPDDTHRAALFDVPFLATSVERMKLWLGDHNV